MNKLKGGLILALIFILSVYCSFYFEGTFEKAIRYLYVTFTNGKISFFIPKKYLRFPSGQFVFSFGLFMTIFCFLLYRQTRTQRIINLLLGLVVLTASILALSYFDSWLKLMECTSCEDGTNKLHYNDINYDAIFIGSLIIALIPIAITEIKRHIKKAKASIPILY